MEIEKPVDNNQAPTEKLIGGITGKGFMPGESGNPGGRPKKKVITEIFEKMLEDPEFVDQVEGSIKKMILSGRMVGQLMLKEMTDRTEGKVVQPIEGNLSMSLAEVIAAGRKRVAERK